MTATRKHPNILITGTPGTGKTTLASLLALSTSLKHVNIGDLVKSKGLHDGYCDEFDAFYLDEDKVCDDLEDQMNQGGNIVDHHSSDFFPERWFDLVVVLTTDNTVLFDRLEKRGYSQKKITENIECEIMQVPIHEALDSYNQDIVQKLSSDSQHDMDSNLERLVEFVESFEQ